LLQAALRHRPTLFWLSVSHIGDEESFLRAYEPWAAAVTPVAPLAVGGRALHESLRARMHYAAYCDKLHHGLDFAGTLGHSATS
jgi:hypothetical protein